MVALNQRDPMARVAARSDKAGHVTLKLSEAGPWLIKAVHMIPAPAGSDSQWASYWASLTFELADADPAGTSRLAGGARMRNATPGRGAGDGGVSSCCWAAVAVSAHEIGTTRVAVTFPQDGTYRVEIVTDAVVPAGQAGGGGAGAAIGRIAGGRSRERLRRHAALIPRRVTLAFDDVRMDPAMRIDVTPSAAVGGVPGATLILTGPGPQVRVR